MKAHFEVRSVLLSRSSTALTLEPVEWMRESETETEVIDGEELPTLVPCEPTDPGAETIGSTGGKMTEVRVDYAGTDIGPGDYVTMTLEWSQNPGRPEH